jgi:hypothetical protein
MNVTICLFERADYAKLADPTAVPDQEVMWTESLPPERHVICDHKVYRRFYEGQLCATRLHYYRVSSSVVSPPAPAMSLEDILARD